MLLKDFMNRAVHNKVFIISSIMVLLVISFAVFAPFLTPFDPSEMDIKSRFSSPSLEHWFGTDQFGSDVFTRVIYGSRLSLQVAITAVLTAVIVG